MHMPENTGGDFKIPPQGTFPARCYHVIDLGTQKGSYNGVENFKRKILLSWELPTELMDDGRPFAIHSRYTFSSHKKAIFRQQLESWRGLAFKDSDFGPGGFDVKNLLNAPCLLGVVHSVTEGSTYANVSTIVRVPKGMDVPHLSNTPALLSLDRGEFDQAVFDMLSENLQETIRRSPEYQEIVNPVQATTHNAPSGYVEPDLSGGLDPEDVIPF